ncbi:MAG: porin family protein [Arcicella sp.]|nr:porin family protein [Arcicella sp.]
MSIRILKSAIFILLLLSNNLNAQLKRDHSIFRFGVKAVSVRGNDSNVSNNLSLKPVIDVGFGINYNLSKNLSFQPEIHYTPRGFSSKVQTTDSTFFANSLELHYLDICPNFNYIFGNQNGFGTKISIWGGPYLGIGITGRNVISGLGISNRGKADSTINYVSAKFGNGLNRIDYGFNVGIGLQIEKITQVGIAYSMGFNNVADNRLYQYYNQSIGVFIAVLFDDLF